MGTTISKNNYLRQFMYKKITIYKQAYIYISGNETSIEYGDYESEYFNTRYSDTCCDAIIKINKNIIFYFDEVYNFNFVSNSYDFIKPIFLNKIYLSDLQFIKKKNNYVLDEKFIKYDTLNYEPLFLHGSRFEYFKSNEIVIENLDSSIKVFSYLKYYGGKLLFVFKCYLCFSSFCFFMKIPIFVNNNIMKFILSYVNTNLLWFKKSFNF